MINLASELEGKKLGNGWIVLSKVDSEIGCFSSAYSVENTETGAQGFLKVLNYEYALKNTNGGSMSTDKVIELAQDFNYERDLYVFCEENDIKSVIRSIGHGEYREPSALYPVPYIIMELATGGSMERDVRMHSLNLKWRMTSFHGIAKALSQLHNGDIAHKDLHAGNILLHKVSYEEKVKLGDLGRADTRNNIRGLHGKISIWSYELFYAASPDDWEWSISYDCFCLGSLLYNLITDSFLGPAVFIKLDLAHRPPSQGGTWKGPYQDILPYLETAFCEVLQELEVSLDALGVEDAFKNRVLKLVESLCHPNPRLRSPDGNYKSELGGTDYSLQRVVSHADWLSKKAGGQCA